MFSLDTGRKLPFYNQRASMNAFVTFTPDSRRIVFSSTAAGGPAQLYMANVDGSSLHRVSSSGTIEVEAKINPKTGVDLVDVSGRSGLPQIYQMNLEGADVQGRFADLKQAAANRCARDLGTFVKAPEVQFHHEVYNQFLWNMF